MTPASAPDKSGKSNVPSIISANLTVTGHMNTNGDVQIDGTIDGDVQSKQITLGESGVVNGAIVADLARISGTVNGSITARVVELGRAAKITGDINHFSLAIEPGAFIQGQLMHVDEQKLKAPVGNGADIKPTPIISADADKKPSDLGKSLPN
ncbi:MAG: polymer-forming cytoskeletal protein [Proteobacteria bacterium]|nr:polymer-forming cytoskeletal protein [Pseudomonadota bacterium]